MCEYKSRVSRETGMLIKLDQTTAANERTSRALTCISPRMVFLWLILIEDNLIYLQFKAEEYCVAGKINPSLRLFSKLFNT